MIEFTKSRERGETLEELKAIIASNIAALRKDAGLTQADLAQKLCYSDKAVSKGERGESIPDVIVLKQVSDLFSVSVDYLLESHEDGETPRDAVAERPAFNRFLIGAVSSGSVWLAATVLFVILSIASVSLPLGNWTVFVYALPVSIIVALVFCCIWGTKSAKAVAVSLLMWSILVSLCITINQPKIWLLLIIGIPGQIIILLSFGIGNRKK